MEGTHQKKIKEILGGSHFQLLHPCLHFPIWHIIVNFSMMVFKNLIRSSLFSPEFCNIGTVSPDPSAEARYLKTCTDQSLWKAKTYYGVMCTSYITTINLLPLCNEIVGYVGFVMFVSFFFFNSRLRHLQQQQIGLQNTEKIIINIHAQDSKSR